MVYINDENMVILLLIFMGCVVTKMLGRTVFLKCRSSCNSRTVMCSAVPAFAFSAQPERGRWPPPGGAKHLGARLRKWVASAPAHCIAFELLWNFGVHAWCEDHAADCATTAHLIAVMVCNFLCRSQEPMTWSPTNCCMTGNDAVFR